MQIQGRCRTFSFPMVGGRFRMVHNELFLVRQWRDGRSGVFGDFFAISFYSFAVEARCTFDHVLVFKQTYVWFCF